MRSMLNDSNCEKNNYDESLRGWRVGNSDVVEELDRVEKEVCGILRRICG